MNISYGQPNVGHVLRWLRLADKEFKDMTLFQLFSTAYFQFFKEVNESKIRDDMATLARHGLVPFYLTRFIRTEMYKMFVRVHEEPGKTLVA